MNFEEMLNKAYEQLDKTKVEENKLVIPEPFIDMQPRKTIWRNTKDFLMVVNRHPDHFLKYLKNQKYDADWLSESKSHGILIKKRIKKGDINRLIVRYMDNYVVCPSCKSINTFITRNKEFRIDNFKCNNCGFNKSV